MHIRPLIASVALLLAALADGRIADAAGAAADPLAGTSPFAADQPWPVEPAKFVESPTNPVIRPKVLVLNFAPRVASAGGKLLWQVFDWHDPRALAAGFIRDLAHVTGGAVVYEIVEWRDLDEFPPFEDGFRYDAETYVANRRIGPGAPWHDGKADFYAIARAHKVAQRVNDGTIDEVWLFGDHYFNLLGEDWMAGPGAFFINGSVFPDFPTDRAFAGYGFNYERHTAEMIHNLAHRTENHMKRAYGGWDMKRPRSPWDRFTANLGRTGGDGPFGIGSCHYPPNGRRDYDYTNPDPVDSTAPDWLNYPNLTGRTAKVGLASWAVPGTKRGQANLGVGTGFEHLQYQRWFFSHLPRADGTAADGRQHNWYKYIFDFNAYAPRTGLPRDNEAFVSASDAAHQGTDPREVRVRIYDVQGVDPTTLGDDDVEVTCQDGSTISVRLVSKGAPSTTTAGFALTARYEMDRALPAGTHRVRLLAGAIRDRAGNPVGETTIRLTVPAPTPAATTPSTRPE